MQIDDFERIVELALDSIPEGFKSKIENVNIVVEDRPTKKQAQSVRSRLRKGILLGLYEGIPKTKRGKYGIGGQLPDRITIFRIPLISLSRDVNDLKRNIRNTLVHEIGHHFGMSEEEISNAMLKNNSPN